MLPKRLFIRGAATIALVAGCVLAAAPASAATRHPRVLAYQYSTTNPDGSLSRHIGLFYVDSGRRGFLVDGTSPTWSPRGRLGYINPHGTISIHNLDGTTVDTGVTPGPFSSLDWSPNGKFIAFDVPAPNADQIWLMSTVRPFATTQVPLGDLGGHGASFSADSKSIVYDAPGEGGDNIASINIDGSPLAGGPDFQGDREGPASWSPDGTLVVFVCNNRGQQGLRLLNAVGPGGGQLFFGVANAPTWSPDSKQVAFFGAPHPWGPPQLIIVRLDGSIVHDYPLAGDRPAWKP